MSARPSVSKSRPGIFRRFARHRDGSTAVEFAIVGPIFFAMLFAILETAMVFFAGQMLETGVHDASRLILTGQAKLSNMTQTQFRDEVCKRASLMLTCSNIYVDVKKQSSFGSINTTNKPVNPCDAFGNNPDFEKGAAGDVMVVRGFYQWPLLVTGLGYNLGGKGASNAQCTKKLLTSTAVFRNEP